MKGWRAHSAEIESTSMCTVGAALHLGELVGRRARVGIVRAGRRLLARRRRPRDNDSTRQEERIQRGE
jgi:hypothetical protein